MFTISGPSTCLLWPEPKPGAPTTQPATCSVSPLAHTPQAYFRRISDKLFTRAQPAPTSQAKVRSRAFCPASNYGLYVRPFNHDIEASAHRDFVTGVLGH
eukprot:scaffold42330_cov97-Phaeocystis_antarctica.AAC.1